LDHEAGIINLKPFLKSLIKTLFKKGLTENGGFDFKSLIPKPYQA
jgi:hypothetical protein